MSNAISVVGSEFETNAPMTAGIASFPESLLCELPLAFVKQAEQGRPMFTIPGNAISRTNQFRLYVIEPRLDVDEETNQILDVKFVVSIFGIMNEDGTMATLSGESGGNMSNALRGFRSLPMSASALVEAGMLSENDYANLVKYANWWAEVEPSLNYEGARAKYRQTITPISPDGVGGMFGFNLVVRQNPNTKEDAVGIDQVVFTGMRVGGNGATGGSGGQIGSMDLLKASASGASVGTGVQLNINRSLRKARPAAGTRAVAPVGAKTVDSF